MYTSGHLAGGPMIRKFRIGATVYADAALVKNIAGPGEVILASVNDATEAVGVSLEAGTYAASSPGQFVRVSYSPFQLVRGKASASATIDTAFSTSVTDQVLYQDTASTTVITDTAVATLDYVSGYAIPLTGSYKGHIRVIDTQTDNTSMTCTVPFPGSIAVGTYVLRTYSCFLQGVELCATYMTQFNNLIAAGEAIGVDAIGEFVTYEIYVDGQACSQASFINILNGTAPEVEFECVFADHAFNSLA